MSELDINWDLDLEETPEMNPEPKAVPPPPPAPEPSSGNTMTCYVCGGGYSTRYFTRIPTRRRYALTVHNYCHDAFIRSR